MRLTLWSGAAALLLSALSSFAQAKPVEAVASFTILADMVHQVGGERVHVTSLIGPNGDPHAYEPTPNDAKALKAADVVFINGLHLEGWMDRLIQASGYNGTPVELSDGIKTRMRQKNGKTVVDPHSWNSAASGVVYVQNIIKALKRIDPEGADQYEANGQRYIDQLKALDAYTKQQIEAVPKAQRKVLTSHNAFGYFGDEYGVTFLSPLDLSTESEASAQKVANLIRQIKEEHITAYFIENSNDPRLVQQIAQATGARAGGELYVESLSKADGPTPTYLKMFRYNVNKMVAAMKGE